MAEGVDRETKLLSKFPWLFGPQTAVFPQTSQVDGLSDVSGARRVPFLSKTTLQFVFLKSYSVCLQVTCDLYLALVIYKLDSCKNTSRTLVKVLLNWILTIFYRCSATPVIRSRTLVTWTCNDFY